MQIVSSTSSGEMKLLSPSGVPGIGWRKLIGMLPTPSSAWWRAKSTLSLRVSPIPMMPPLQTFSPTRFAAAIVSSLADCGWVVQTVSK